MGGGKSIQFKTGDTNKTYHITIKQDQLCEIEFFYVNIDLNSDVQPLDVNVSQAKAFINDSNEPECGKGHKYSNILSYIYIYVLRNILYIRVEYILLCTCKGCKCTNSTHLLKHGLLMHM